tara:strand:+ start:98 stop:583 length:486 start_codon:yes stop_codon:yes gene_type:complete
MAKTLDLVVPVEDKSFYAKMKKLLSNKDKLVKQDAGDGRNQYQIEITKLKKKIKEYNKNETARDGLPKVKFGSILRDVQKQEREGTFDRGAEGKAKNALRKKMVREKSAEQGGDSYQRGGVHAGTQRDRENTLSQRVRDDSQFIANQKKKKKKPQTGPRAK